jgi:hypothetical protein
MKQSRYYLAAIPGAVIGVRGDLNAALQADHPFERLDPAAFEPISEEEYENTVLDWRFENNEWTQ